MDDRSRRGRFQDRLKSGLRAGKEAAGAAGAKASDALGQAGAKASDALGQAGSKASDALGQAGAKASDALGQAGAKASDLLGQAGQIAAHTFGEATDALRLEVVDTALKGARVLAGHAIGMKLLIPAEGIHGPRETPVLIYVFSDAIAIRPTDDAPMSAVPLYGLHIILPQVAVARWIYKAGRTVHADVNLESTEHKVAESLANWTVDDFRQADDKLQVFMLDELVGPIHVYQRLGLLRLAFELPDRKRIRLKSCLPESSSTRQQLSDLFVKVAGSEHVTMESPTSEREDEAAEQPASEGPADEGAADEGAADEQPTGEPATGEQATGEPGAPTP